MINYLITKEESKEDPSDLIYDPPECFMMTWEELWIAHLPPLQNMIY